MGERFSDIEKAALVGKQASLGSNARTANIERWWSDLDAHESATGNRSDFRLGICTGSGQRRWKQDCCGHR